jgi:uncharacterized damage-inducible protein DinB
MSNTSNDTILDIILDSWDRNNRIVVNLLRAIPSPGTQARVMPSSPSVGEMFVHMLYVRLIFLSEDIPESNYPLPPREWFYNGDVDKLATELDRSARVVRSAVKSQIESGKEMKLHYDHPLYYLQHMIWHEGYHHGQIKLALKLAGHPFDDEEIGPITWEVWMDKTAKTVKA